MLERAKAIQDKLIALRRTIHMNPELSFQEFKTAAYNEPQKLDHM